MTKKIITLILLFYILIFSVGCGIHPFDKSQVPIISIDISTGQNPVISWTPDNAYQIGIYKGVEIDNGSIREIWNIGKQTGYENKVKSPVTVTTPLEIGETYSVYVQRKDTKGKGDGFSNTRHRYIGKKTFIVTDMVKRKNI